MKLVMKICIFLSGALAVLSIIMGIRMLFGGSMFMGIRLFSIVASGGFFGFMGNLLSIVITAGGFGGMAIFGIAADTDRTARKNAFIFGGIMTGVCLVSAVFAIARGVFTMGDLSSFLLPLVYTTVIFKSA